VRFPVANSTTPTLARSNQKMSSSDGSMSKLVYRESVDVGLSLRIGERT
jgi:hypothetical protein